MSYTQRVLLAACCSLLLHGLFLGAWPRRADSAFRTQVRPEPLVLNLQPQPERRLINAHTPAEQLPEATDLVASMDSQAMDAAVHDGVLPGPQVAENDFDDLALAESPLTADPRPIHAPLPDIKPVERETPSPQAPPEAPAPIEGPEPELPTAEPGSPLSAAAEAVPAEAPGRFDLAKAGVSPFPEPSPRVTKGRVREAIMKEGATSFEAQQEQFAPYLHEVRRRVEREWNAALTMRYAGTSPTKAVVECAIAPDGTLAHVAIVGTPEDRVYAALCKDAVEKAGPFRPFPFTIPDVYRSENLDIRWTFSFL